MDPKEQYEIMARASIEAGLLTAQERDLLARKGTRKAGYHGRHLADLIDLVTSRMVSRARVVQEIAQAVA